MLSLLKLVRIQNLIIIALTQYLVRQFLVSPLLKYYGFDLQMDAFSFFLLVLATICITAAGYVINDYFDTKTDILNRPKEVIVGNRISRRQTMSLHIVLNLIGIGIGLYLAFMIKLPILSLVFMLIAGLLWFYSTSYKRQFLTGNIIVALLTALVPIMVILFEIPMLNKEYARVLIQNQMSFGYIVTWVFGFSYFAFLLTLIREIIKDAEDFEGDMAYGRNTIPIVLGMGNTKVILYGLIVIFMASLIYVYLVFLNDIYTLVYILIALLLPVSFMVVKVFKAENKKDYHKLSLLAKFLMLAGLFYSIVANFVILYKIEH